MKTAKLEAVKAEMIRLQKTIYDLERMGEYMKQGAKEEYFRSPKHTGAVRRASMDLTRALANLRRRKP
jgi:hypothetical protein